MFKVTTYRFISLLLFLVIVQNAYAQTADISVDVNYVVIPQNGVMTMKGGQWVTEGETTVSGEITLLVKIDEAITKFTTKIIGNNEKNGLVTYQCANGESFYIDDAQTAHPVISSKFTLGNKQFKKSVDDFNRKNTNILAWDIWKHVHKQK